ncbi:MAG: hypothetical protein LC657_05295, partial [Desulfobacteraceae bacterium]|nr:hypothetical protein [Desulfobacteraceae bacterium]
GIFAIWKELYESDFQKFYNIPQLGLTRNYQEQINTNLDRGNRFFLAFSEFMNLLYVPVEKAGNVTLERYQEMVERKEISDDPKMLYKLWIKSLEGYYMQMLQSPEYNRALSSVISTHSEYKESKGKILQTFLHQLQIPTNKEMDELYKETYLLKKKVRGLEKKLAAAEKATSPKKPTSVKAKPSAKKPTSVKAKPSTKKPAEKKKTTSAKASAEKKTKK